MEEIKSLDIVTESGEVASAKVVSFLKDDENDKIYVFYTFEVDEAEEYRKIYASIFVQNESGYELLPIEDENEWKFVNEEIIKLTNEGE